MLARVVGRVKSERGASLSMALMLFLVCAMVSTVVLAAATVAAGRQGLFQKMEKSYYNVSSAAKLFWDELNDPNGGSTVRVQWVCSRATLSDDGTFVPAADAEYTAKIDGADRLDADALGTAPTLFQIVAYDLLFGSASASKFDFGARGVISPTLVSEGLGVVGVDGELLDPSQRGVSDATYGTDADCKTFAIVVDDESEFASVQVETQRKSDGSLVFTFHEKDNESSYRCTIEAPLGCVASEQLSKRNDDDTYSLSWETTLTWRPLSINLGGGVS